MADPLGIIQIPTTYEDIVEEIMTYTGLPREEVSHRVWMEALVPCWNVINDCEKNGVTPHIYDKFMEHFYLKSDSFVFDTMVYWSRPDRQEWIRAAFNRISKYADENHAEINNVKILMLGDGSGNDSIYLSNKGCNLDYSDVPGSKIFNFAKNRFDGHGILNKSVCLIEEYSTIGLSEYDFIVCFELLEHLNEPLTAIYEMRQFLKPGGYALISEDFGGISHTFPTHLKKNACYYGRTSMLFQKYGMKLTWYNQNPIFKPMEFKRQDSCSLSEKIGIFRDCKLVKKYLLGFVKRIRQPHKEQWS